MTVQFYLQSLRRNWWIVAITALTGVFITLLASYFSTPIYRTTARFIISPDQSIMSSDSDVVNSLNTLDKRSIIATYAEVLNSQRIQGETTGALSMDARTLEDYSFTTTVLPEANILELTVQGPDPELIVQIADGIGNNAIQYIRGLYTVYTLSLLDPAGQPLKPISPQPVRDASLSFVLGLGLGSILAILRDQMVVPMSAFIRRNEIDKETMVLTRFQFENRLNQFLTERNNRILAIGIIRLEGLRGYIEVLPQPVVQLILRQVTAILENELRGSDVVARWNKFSFAVILPDTPTPAAVSTMGRVQVALSKAIRYGMDGESLLLQPIVGLAEHENGLTPTALIRQAEKALANATRIESRFGVMTSQNVDA